MQNNLLPIDLNKSKILHYYSVIIVEYLAGRITLNKTKGFRHSMVFKKMKHSFLITIYLVVEQGTQ